MSDLKDRSSLDEEIRAATKEDAYPPNSHKSREKKVEKVISGEVKTRKLPLSKKFINTFLSDDVEDVKGYLFFDVLIPSIKETIWEMASKGLEMILFGGTSKSSSSHGINKKKNYVSYDKASYINSTRRTTRRDSGVNDWREIIFDTRGQAEEVLSNMADMVIDYGQVTVADLYDLAGVTKAGDFTAEKYGWVDVSTVKIRMVRGGGYILDLPKVELLV